MQNYPTIGTGNDDGALVVSSLVSFLVHQTPSLESLNREELKKVAQGMVFDSLKDDLRNLVELEKINYDEKKLIFLSRAAKRSPGTEKAYRGALEALEGWATRKGIRVLEIKPKDADAFIDALEGSPSSIRLKAAACSSFFSFLDRETEGRIKNAFRGTKARPKKSTKEPELPSLEEIEAIKSAVAPAIQAAIVVMVELGLRVGALPSLTLRAGKYSAMSKGNEITGSISTAAFRAIQNANLDTKRPFAELSNDAARNAFKYAAGKLYRAKTIRAPYSVHDLRHFFAIAEYRKDRDIYRLKVLLGHSSIQVTETYLKGLERYWQD